MRFLVLCLFVAAASCAHAAEDNGPIAMNTDFPKPMSSEAFNAFKTIQYQIAMNALKAHIDTPDVIDVPGVSVAMDDVAVSLVEDLVSRDLSDPYTAVFSDHRALAFGNDHGSLVACGWVNAKNSFGGYVGQRPFIVSMTNPHLSGEIQSASEVDEAWVLESCLKLGLLEW